MTQTAHAEPRPPRPAGRIWAWSAALVALDTFILNQGVLAFLVLLWNLLVVIPACGLSPRRRRHWRPRLRNAGMLILASASVLLLNAWFSDIAADRAEKIIRAVESYQRDNGDYPDSLAALVPTHLNAVPASKPSLSFDDFIYRRSRQGAFLMYTEVPPFGRRSYDFVSRRWSYID